ncbi:hypothetical protein HY041_02295, partial [Candidatus Roizmanbacteria bacterium]|nr:hypothetical protein [Candidatus Roizmanbacteria bacterium]
LVLDLFINKGEPATFDGPTHLMNIAMFFKSMRGGEWHVTWTDGFANYGMPIGLIAQQTTSYLGAIINFITQNIILSYNFVLFIGAFLSSLFFYLFLRLYFKPGSSLAGTFLFHFAPYRIINIYIRGSLPEFFASVFLPLILIGLFFIFNNRVFKGFILVSISTVLVILTHPMMVIIYGFIIGPYLLYLCSRNKNIITSLMVILSAFILGVGLAGYYIFPLQREVKYFYYGLDKNHFAKNQSMSLSNFIDPNWYYFLKGDIFTRGHFIQSGFLEIVLVGIAILAIVFIFAKTKKLQINLLHVSVFISLLLIFFMSKYSIFLFERINFISNIQHQWRLFSAFIFIPPMILAYFLDRFDRKILLYGMIILICLLRFPQLYGKNYTIYPDSHYFFWVDNLHGNIMNTIWTGPTRDYPIKKEKLGIIEGKGTIISNSVNSSIRKYRIAAETDVRIVDYTFYFPGWKAYVDQVEVPIQFQDPAYRGVITYEVPKGEHEIVLRFTNTKVRLLGIVLSALSLFSLFGIIIVAKIYVKQRSKTRN